MDHPIRTTVRWAWRITKLMMVLGVGTIGLSALSNLGFPSPNQMPHRLSSVEKARVAEAFHLRSNLGDQVWPGWGSTSIPLLVFNQSFAFLLGYDDPPTGWFDEPGHRHMGAEWDPVEDDGFRGRPYFGQPIPPEDFRPQAFAARVGERWVGSLPTEQWAKESFVYSLREQLPPVLRSIVPYRLVTGLLFRGAEHHVSLLLHEAFHAHQAQVAPGRFVAAEAAVALESTYPWDDAEMVAAWRRELALLADAVSAQEDEAAALAVDQFLQARRERRRLLSPELRVYEQEREWLEGVAKFVEMKVLLLAQAHASYKPVGDLEQDPSWDAYRGAGAAWKREVAQVRRMATQGETRFYYSGMALSALLDLFDEGWKDKIMEPGVQLDELLEGGVGAWLGAGNGFPLPPAVPTPP